MKTTLTILVGLLLFVSTAFAQPVSEIDPHSIHKDGTTTTTAEIPFAQGVSVPDQINIYFGATTTDPAKRTRLYDRRGLTGEHTFYFYGKDWETGDGSQAGNFYLAGGSVSSGTANGGDATIYGGSTTLGRGGHIRFSPGGSYSGAGGSCKFEGGQSEEGQQGWAGLFGQAVTPVSTPGVNNVAIKGTLELKAQVTPNTLAAFDAKKTFISVTAIPTPTAHARMTPALPLDSTGVTDVHLNYDSTLQNVAGSLAVTTPTPQPTPTAASYWYGNGHDGDVTISVDTTLTRDMNYSSLVVNSGTILTAKGYRILVTGTLENNGTIQYGNASAGANGSGCYANGIASAALSTSCKVGVGPLTQPTPTPWMTPVAAATGIPGRAGATGTTEAICVGTTGTSNAAASGGSAGGVAGGPKGGNGGAGGGSGTCTTNAADAHTIFGVHYCKQSTYNTFAAYGQNGGSGTGGQGGFGGTDDAGAHPGCGGHGGGAGQNGGVQLIAAVNIIGSGVFKNNGANGGAGGLGGNASCTSGSAGGGGGGQGGAGGSGGRLQFYYHTKGNGWTTDVTGGIGGRGGTGGTGCGADGENGQTGDDGIDGIDGEVYEMVVP